MTVTYENQLEIVQRLQPASSDDERHIDWCEGNGPIGLARDYRGRIEIFLEGPGLEPRFSRVRSAIEHQRWFRAGGSELVANRILLPAAGHFEQVAAFLCTELLRNGANEDLPRAFGVTEPLIEIAITELLMADETLLGLCGELFVLQSLLRAVRDRDVRLILDSWKGYRETARDFQVGPEGVEVKTTTRQTSSHQFSGIHQMEVGHGVDGAEETGLTVVSLGLEWVDDREPDSTTLPELAEQVINWVQQAAGSAAPGMIAEFLDRLTDYGAAAAIGYDHRTMAAHTRFNRRMRLRFARGYDMTDPAIRLLTTDDLRARPLVDANSVRVRVNFPDRVTGDVNPVAGLATCASQITRASLTTEE